MTKHQTAPRPSTSAGLRDVWRLLASFRGARRYVLATVLLSVIASLAEAATIALVAAVALAVVGDGEPELDLGTIELGAERVTEALWLGAAAVAVVAVARVALAFSSARLSTVGVVQARRVVLGSYLRTSWEVQESERAGHVHELASMHAGRVSQTFHLFASFVVSLVAFTVLTAAALLAAPAAAASMLLLTAMVTISLRPLGRRTRRESANYLMEHNRVVAAVEEATVVTAEVRVFGVTDAMHARLDEAVTAVARPHMRARFTSLVIPGLMGSATMGALVGGLAVINALAISDPLRLGVAVLLLLRNMRYAQGALSSAQIIVEQWAFLEELRDSVARYQSAVPPVRGSTPLDSIETIRMAGVEYVYPNGEPALRGVDLEIRAGDVVGLVGPSGGGKTTLVQVLLGLRAPTAGRVLVSGIDLSEVRSDDWHSLIAYVGQDPRLVSGDVRDNVRFFRSSVSDDDVERAIAAAALSDVTSAEMDSRRVVGESGRELSGGQRQRIALARAFAGDAQLIVLDEPTSALDVTSERKIQATLADLPGHVTVVLIAHRPSTLTVCDRLVVMERGVVREVPPPTDEAAASRLLMLVTGGEG